MSRPGGGTTTLILSGALREQLAAEARTALPEECCGLVEGIREGEAVRALALHAAANLAADPAAGFEIDPAVHFRLLRALRGTGREVVGCYHSHPGGGTEPSQRDRVCGCEEGFIWIIAGVGDEVALGAYAGPQFRAVVLAG